MRKGATSMQEGVSAFHERANEPVDEQQSKPSFFARLCGNCGTSEEHTEQNSTTPQRNVSLSISFESQWAIKLVVDLPGFSHLREAF